MWNPPLELLFLEQASGIFASYLVEIDYGHDRIVLSLSLCYKEGVYDSCLMLHRAL